MQVKAWCSIIAFLLAGCSAGPKPAPCPDHAGGIIYVVEEGWHAEIGIPVEELGDELSFYQHVFPGARVIMFGYGKKTFVISQPDSFSEYILGPVPGPAVIHALGISVTPQEAYTLKQTTILSVTPEGLKALSAFIGNDLVKETDGKARVVARSTNPDGLFYAAHSGYSLLHTCNSWVAEALHASGLPVLPDGVTFAHQVIGRTYKAQQSQCPINQP